MKGEMTHIYGASSKPSAPPASALAGIIRIWLRAGHAGQCLPELKEKFAPWEIDAEEFVTLFNVRTNFMAGNIVPVVIRIFEDGTYDFHYGRFSRIRPPLLPEISDPFRGS